MNSTDILFQINQNIELMNKLKAMEIALSITTINIGMNDKEKIKTITEKANLILSQEVERD